MISGTSSTHNQTGGAAALSSFIFEDSSDLPYGWRRFKKKRLNSATYDRCILTSCGTRIDRQKKLDNFISAKELDLNISFSGSGRKSLATAPVTIEKNKKLNSSPRRKNPPKLATNQSTLGATFPGQFVTNRPPPTSPPGDRLETTLRGIRKIIRCKRTTWKRRSKRNIQILIRNKF